MIVEGQLVDLAIAEVANEQVALAIEDDAIQAVLRELVLGDEAGQKVGVVQGIIHLDIPAVRGKTVDRADHQAVGPLDLGQLGYGNVHLAVAQPQSVGVADPLGHHGSLDQLVAIQAQAQDAALVDLAIGSVSGGPVLVVDHIQLALRAELDSHGARPAGLGAGWGIRTDRGPCGLYRS